MAVGREVDAAMGQHLQIGEMAGQAAAALGAELGEPVEQDQQPARRAADGAYVLVRDGASDGLDLALPVLDTADMVGREIAAPHPAGHLARADAAEVAAMDARRQRRRRRAAAEQEAPTGEDARARPVGEVMGVEVQRRAPVGGQHRPRQRDVLGAAAGGARRHGEIGDRPRPGDVGEDREVAAPVGFPGLLEAAQRHEALEARHVGDRGEVVIAPEARGARPAHEAQELALLLPRRVLARQAPGAAARIHA